MGPKELKTCLETYHKSIHKEKYKKESIKEFKSGIEDLIFILILYLIVDYFFL
jgi:hypothetical protein